MQIGDLVIYKGWHGTETGIITGFDEDNDPKVLNSKTGIVAVNYRSRVEVISANR